MTTLTGLASKGEKGKSKFQSLDINSLYRVSRGESLEPHQQKNTLPRKHGMQSLGKVPSARRPPANLPSLKSEHSGSDAAVSLVPSGGPGWGKQDGGTSSSPPTTPPTTTAPPSAGVPNQPTAPPTLALPIPSPNKTPPAVAAAPAASDKTWSAVMAGTDVLGHQPPPYQSPQFQHEFPSLSAGEAGVAGTQKGGVEVQYGPGPSLRPQTEGSWIQGGNRGADAGPAAAKGSSVQLAGPPQLLAPAGPVPPPMAPIPHQHMLPQFRGVVPPFMYRGNFPPPNGVSNFSAMTSPLNVRGRFPTPGVQFAEQRPSVRSAPPVDLEEVTPRPIIKEEDLNRMDDMTRDVGWASHDDIDYNQKLAFSDDETSAENEMRKEPHKREPEKVDVSASEVRGVSSAPPRGWNSARMGSQPATPQTGRNQNARGVEDEEIWNQRRKQHKEEVAVAAERAKLRREEEEKRFMKSKQAAAKKLQELEEKLKEKKEAEQKENEEGQGTINPSAVPPQPITPVPIPVPEWEKERENREKSRTPNETTENKSQNQVHRESDFRQLTQIESRNFISKSTRNEREISHERECRERDRDIRERDGPNFSRHFQSNLPPRFQKQQAERQGGNVPYHRGNNASSPQPQQPGPALSNVPFAQQYDSRWVQTNSFPNKSAPVARKTESGFERDREDERDLRRDRATPDDVRQSDRAYLESNRKFSGDGRYYEDYRGTYRQNSQESEYKRDREEDKWEKDREQRHYDERKEEPKKLQTHDSFEGHEIARQDSGEWHKEKYFKDGWEERSQDRHREDTSQRPDSRDSRISKESTLRDNDYTGNWADSPFEPAFNEEKKKDTYREERRQVPGPITKEKIEADDLKNEKRHLIQLKRSSVSSTTENKVDDKVAEKKGDDAWTIRKKESTPERRELGGKAWPDLLTSAPSDNSKFTEALEKGSKKTLSGEKLDTKPDAKKEKENTESTKEKDDKHFHGSGSRSRTEPSRSHRSGPWMGGYTVYNWSKRNEPRSSNRGSQRPGGHRHRDWHITDSEPSGDEISVSTESGKEDRSGRHGLLQQSPKPLKKLEKDEKNKEVKQDKPPERRYDKRMYEQNSRNRETFVPRGEPSRHGRGGFRGPRSVTSKRNDGYGIPPSKSPFSNQHEEKDKKLSSDEVNNEAPSSDEKTKLNQQALSAGIIGSARNLKSDNTSSLKSYRRSDEKRDTSRGRKQKPKSNKSHSDVGEGWETTSENSEVENDRKDKGRKKSGSRSTYMQSGGPRQTASNLSASSRQNNLPRNSEKRNFTRNEQHLNMRQNSSSSIRSNQNLKVGSGKESIKDDGKSENKPECADNDDDKNVTHSDADGFQEVRSKKNVKDRQKEEKVTTRSSAKTEKDSRGMKSKVNSPVAQLTPQQIANIPPLLSTPVNPPNILSMSSSMNNKMSFDRSRQNQLPPRFAKQRENNRLQKVQMQQNICDVNDMNKINQSVSMYSMKEGPAPAPVPITNAWDKPITSQLRNSVDPDLMGIGVENCTELEQTQQSSTSSQRSSPSNDKVLGGKTVVQDKAVLDGTTPLVNTIIFENTNYKSVPVASDLAVKSKFTTHLKSQQRTDKTRNKLEDGEVDSSVMSSFNKPMPDILNKNDSKPESMQMPLSFKTEDNADMKLDFTFDSDLSQLTDDKNTKSLGLPRSVHTITSGQNTTISPLTAELNLKIASVKKVWDTTMPTVLEHTVVQEDSVTNNSGSFSSSFGPDPNSLDHSNAFTKGSDTPDDNEGYSPSPSQSCTSNNTTNVCKVKPTQQLAGSGQAVHSVNTHHAVSQQHPGVGNAGQHSAMVGQSLIGHPLSPPPLQQVLGAGVGLSQPPQQYTSNQHINYQPSLGGSTQYGSMSAIPSPPTVLFNSTQQMPTQGGLYGAFQIDQSQVLNTQGRSQYSQYPNPYGLGQTASSPYSAQSMYLQTPPHPPPSAQPPPDIYQSLSSQYRMTTAGPFGQSQQLTNNPSTVLISSTSNSLMSATVKPSSQISAIGTKAGTVGQAYQQQSQQGQQLYIPYDPNLQANYLSSQGVLQRGPTGPVQNSVVPGLQPSSSYYSGSAGAQTGFYQQPTNSTMQSAPIPQHQTSFGLQGNVFGTHNQSHGSAAGLQSFGSQFLSSPMQLAAAAALSAQQQYRSSNLPNPNYLKGVGTQHITDQTGRQQLKSPSANQQDVLTTVFNMAPQIPSPKSRQNCKQPPPQSSPTQHKYSAYQSVNNQSAQIAPTRYPPPIQRPVNFQPGSLQNSGNMSNRHRPTHNQNSRGPQRQYYGGQGSGISSHTDKSEDSKLNENNPPATLTGNNSSMITNSNGVGKVGVSNGNGNSTNQNSEMVKDVVKDEAIIKE